MKRGALLPLLAVVFLTAGVVCLQAEEAGAASSGNLTFEQIESLGAEYKWLDVVNALQPEDLTAKATELGQDVDRLYSLRALAYRALKKGEESEADYTRALAESPDDGRKSNYWFSRAENYEKSLGDPKAALAAYQEARESCFERGNKNGSLPFGATLGAVAILCSESRYEEAQLLMEPYDGSMEHISSPWDIKLLRASAEIYKGLGKEDEASERLQKAQDLEEKPESNP